MNKSSEEGDIPVAWAQLLEAYCNDTLDETSFEALQELLRREPDARALFVRYTNLDAALIGASDRYADVWTDTQTSSRLHPGASPAHRMPGWFAAAAAIALAFGLAWLLDRDPADKIEAVERLDDSVAVLAETVDVVWEGRALQRGSALKGILRLRRGLIQIDFYSGASVVLEGPGALELTSANSAVCHGGRIRAHVPHHARGFEVRAGRARVIDLGTEFALNVDRQDGAAELHVFDGEVRWQRIGESGPSQHLDAGQAVRIDAAGGGAPIAPRPEAFLSIDEIHRRALHRRRDGLRRWRSWLDRQARDDRLVVRYTFEPDAARPRVLHPHRLSSPGLTGSIVGCQWAAARWGQPGLLFRRPSDRVRVDIAGRHDRLTLTAWVRVDALPNRLHGLLLTDGYRPGRPHWQISQEGTLRLGVRLPDEKDKSVRASGYGSPPVFTPERLGVWTFLATVYDAPAGLVRHHVNGRQVSEHRLVHRQPLAIGPAEIGNWGRPLDQDAQPVRNLVGCLDEMAVWSDALDPQTIAQQYEAGRP